MRAILENRLATSDLLISVNTAILAIHWQNDIVLPSGAFGSIFADSIARTGALRHAATAVAESRRRGALVVHVLAAYDSNYRGHVVNNALFRTVEQRHAFIRRTSGAAICSELQPEDVDLIAEHRRISAFHGTDLSAQLRAAGILNLAITGVATNVAVDHTTRDAVQEGFNTYLLEDCCCSSNSTFHDAAMLTLNALSTHVLHHGRFLELLK